MFMHLLGTAMHSAEAGKLPDRMIRFGIRHLLRKRLESLRLSNPEDRTERFRQFVTDCRNGPIALVPDLANEQHYEVPPEFFRTVLGHRLKYSCCHWPACVTSLDDAEDSALQVTCGRAGIEDGMDILELGCGWGSLTLWMAERFPGSRILAVSNSASQRQFVLDRAGESGFSNVEVVTADMNGFATERSFDRVVSIEMFEHMRNHKELMRRVAGWLNPAGRLFVHIFCHARDAYPFETEGDHNWMGRHFFSGGMMPSDSLLLHYQQDLSLVDQWRWNGCHYEITCNEWLRRQDANRDSLHRLFIETCGEQHADRWFNRWRIFFMACAELFGCRNGSEWWVSHYLFEKRP